MELDVWERRLLTVIEDTAPRAHRKIVRKAGNLLRKNARRITPKVTGNLRRAYRVKMEGKDAVTVYNPAPHAHLVEEGHKLVLGGKLGKGGHVVGFVPGKFYLRKALDKTDQELPELLKEMVHQIGRELGMDVSD